MCYDMIYLLNVIGLTPGGSSTLHIYTKTMHKTTQWSRINRMYITIRILIDNIENKCTEHFEIHNFQN
jgi:hypothetical protein